MTSYHRVIQLDTLENSVLEIDGITECIVWLDTPKVGILIKIWVTDSEAKRKHSECEKPHFEVTRSSSFDRWQIKNDFLHSLDFLLGNSIHVFAEKKVFVLKKSWIPNLKKLEKNVKNMKKWQKTLKKWSIPCFRCLAPKTGWIIYYSF